MSRKPHLDIDKNQLVLLKALIKSCIPGKTVWAYGSRVVGQVGEKSDLDLVVFDCYSTQITDFKTVLEESRLTVLVNVMDWESIPNSFKENIKKNYTVLQEGSKIY